MEHKDLVPEPQYRRRMVGGPIAPPAPPRMAQAKAEQDVMGITCPNCRTLARHPRKVGLLFCKAEDPPFFGEGRGCGWLLAVFPPSGAGTRGRAEAIMDCNRHFRPDRIDPVTGKPAPGFKLPRDVYERVVLHLWERWQGLGLGTIHKREDGSLEFHPSGMGAFAALTPGSNRVGPPQ
jgi:hypothetical protein